MVLVDGNKYACEACIKGHRASTCQHTDRALFEIKRKGRPATQCDNCRHLRKTKQLHVKCICEGKEDSANLILPPAIKKGHTTIPGSATFPNGLPGALGSGELQAYPDAASSESDNGGCMSKRTGSCNCCTRRKSAPRTRKRNSASGAHPMRADSSNDRSQPLAELRPVLPRPSRPLHNLSDFTHEYHARHHSQENLLLSQTHNIAHPYSIFRNRSVPSIVMRDNLSIPPPPILAEERRSLNQYPSVCGCGDSGSCPGCPQHNSTSGASTSVCSTCFDCPPLSLPTSLSSADTSLSRFDAYPAESINDWVTQVSSFPRDSSGRALQRQQIAWDNYLVPITEPPSNTEGRYRIQPCCGVSCKCSPETCECDIDREDGYDCRRESLTPDSTSTFPASDDNAVVMDAFNDFRTTMPINGSDDAGTHIDGLVRSQSVGAIYPGPGSWDVRNFGPVVPARSRSLSLSLSLSASSSRSSHQFFFDFDDFSPSDDFNPLLRSHSQI